MMMNNHPNSTNHGTWTHTREMWSQRLWHGSRSNMDECSWEDGAFVECHRVPFLHAKCSVYPCTKRYQGMLWVIKLAYRLECGDGSKVLTPYKPWHAQERGPITHLNVETLTVHKPLLASCAMPNAYTLHGYKFDACYDHFLFLVLCLFPILSHEHCFTCLWTVPLEHLPPKHSFPVYTVCMAMHYLIISSQGLSSLLTDAISVPVFTQLSSYLELALLGPCTVSFHYIN